MLKIFKKSRRKKVLGIGLDGVPCTLIDTLISRGDLPNIASLCDSGTRGSINSSLPEISSVAWSSFMTGEDPSVHGIYGFIELKPGTYDFRFPNFKDIQAETIWQKLEKQGKRSIILNIPSSYPAPALNGILTAGFVAVDLRKATYPDPAYRYLKRIGYQADIDFLKARDSADELFKAINYNLDKRIEAFQYFRNNEQWDLFIGVITETDRLHHFCLSAFEDESHPHHEDFLDFYRRIDRYIGQVLDSIDDATTFFMLSDHGFTLIKHEVYLNSWLKKEGYLNFETDNPSSLNELSPESRAFALDPSRIYINRKGKYPKGKVGGESHKLLEELSAKLTAWVDSQGNPVLRKVFPGKELYQGPCQENAPDLVLLSHHGYDLKGSVKRPEIFGRSPGLEGMHTYDDAFFLSNRPDAGISEISEISRFILDSF
ncbi:MAG: alkaline phosphatase family protein [bacterium]